MSKWIPDAASLEIEQAMEEKDLPESDRDEIRKFGEFLRRRAAKRKGEPLPPLSPEMRAWLLGEDSTPPTN